MTRRNSRAGHRWALLLLILLAFALRVYQIDAFSFWTDEGLTPLRAGYSIPEILSNRVIIRERVTQDTHPPLFFLIIHFTRQLFGESTFAYRYPAALWSVLLLPLLYQLGRRLWDRRLGLLVAWLTAVNPLHVWYAKEARMYTLFIWLMAAAAYVLWRLLNGGRPRRYVPLYLLLAGLSLYTVYTAVFLIAAHALFWVSWLWKRGYRRLIIGAALLGLLAAIPLIPFTVPRLFTGAEASYYYVSPYIMLQDVVHFFNLGLSTDFSQWPVRLLDIAALILLLLGVYAAGTWRRRFFLLAYLLAVVFGLMLGSLLKPMYQGVRHIMVGSPAFLLLVGWGLLFLIDRAAHAAGRRRYTAQWTAVALGLAVALFAPLHSLSNLFTDPAYAKDDFRDLVRYAEAHAGGNDVMVYNNAILLPLHRHFQRRPDLAATARPVYPYPAGDVAPAMEQLAASYDRIWFVTDPPTDGRDDQGLVQGWLESHLNRVDSHVAHARTTVVAVIGYDAGPAQAEALPEEAAPLELGWPRGPAPRGVALPPQPVAAPALWLDLFWAGEAPPSNTRLRFSLLGPAGETWLVAEKPWWPEETAWPASDLIRRAYGLPLPLGIPPGSYQLWLQAVDENGIPLAPPQAITEVALAAESEWPAQVERPFPPTTPRLFSNGVVLAGVALPDDEVRPGHNIPLTVFWEAERPLNAPDLRYRLEVIAADGSVLRHQEDPPAPAWLEQWPAETLLREETGLYFRPETPPGRYHLRWQLKENGKPLPGGPWWQLWPDEHVELGTVWVRPWPLQTSPPDEVDEIVGADFGPNISLYGYDAAQYDAAQYDAAQEGGQLGLTLYWRAQGQPQDNYFVFVHLVNEAGEIVSQRDVIPVDGLRPTPGWRPGELLTDPHLLTWQPPLPDGAYTVQVGLFQPEAGTRLPVTLAGERLPGDALPLFTVTAP